MGWNIGSWWGPVGDAAGRLAGKRSGRGGGRNARAEAMWRELGLRPPSEYGHGAGKLGWDPNSAFTDDAARQAFYDQAMGGLDEFGNPMFLPGSDIAPDIQHFANIKARTRNDRLLATAGQEGASFFGQARGALGQGLETLQSYRPGGAAALTSGYYGGMANTYAQQAGFGLNVALARQQDAPDVMFRYNEKIRHRAQRDARTAGTIKMIAGGAGAIAGMAMGNPAVAMAGAQTAQQGAQGYASGGQNASLNPNRVGTVGEPGVQGPPAPGGFPAPQPPIMQGGAPAGSQQGPPRPQGAGYGLGQNPGMGFAPGMGPQAPGQDRYPGAGGPQGGPGQGQGAGAGGGGGGPQGASYGGGGPGQQDTYQFPGGMSMGSPPSGPVNGMLAGAAGMDPQVWHQMMMQDDPGYVDPGQLYSDRLEALERMYPPPVYAA